MDGCLFTTLSWWDGKDEFAWSSCSIRYAISGVSEALCFDPANEMIRDTYAKREFRLRIKFNLAQLKNFSTKLIYYGKKSFRKNKTKYNKRPLKQFFYRIFMKTKFFQKTKKLINSKQTNIYLN